MSKLKKYRFCELYEMSSGISSKKEQAGHGSPFLSFSAVFNNYFLPENLTDLMDASEKEQGTYSIKEGDIFLTRTSEVVDELAMSSVSLKGYPKATFSGFLKRLRPTQSDITYAKFMAFYLRSPLFRKTMTNNAVMTLRASLNEAIFSYLDLLLPEYDEQVKGGDLLYLFNQKIALNNRINTELEAMAKTLYDYWFVQFDFPYDFEKGQPDPNGKPYKSSGGKMTYNPTLKREIPEGWGNALIGDVIGRAPNSEKILNRDIAESGEIPVVDQSQDYICGFTNNAEALIDVSSPHIVFGDHTRVVKLVNFSYARGADGTQILVPVKKELPGYLLFQMVKDIDLSNYGYARHFKFLKESKIVVPNQKVANSYEEKVTPMFCKVRENIFENIQLSKVRDWLLPMLMNGQATVQ